MQPTKKLPLFIITGASCVGKSTVSEVLFKRETHYIVMESDLLWNEFFNTPDDDYRKYRELWLTLCSNISQIGLPVVLCGCGVPKQFELCDGRRYFSSIHYLAIVSDDDVLKDRMCIGRGVTDDHWISSSINFNRWLKENAHRTAPPVKLLDTTKLSPKTAADIVDEWIKKCMKVSSADSNMSVKP